MLTTIFKVVQSLIKAFIIFDYSIEDVVGILKNLNESNITEDSFRNTTHLNYSNNRRHSNLEMIYDHLINGQYVAILKSEYNSFKILYEPPTIKSVDLCIVIVITDDKGIKLITTYNQDKERRVRTYDR